MSDARLRARWRPDQAEPESWELECRLAVAIGNTREVTVTGGSMASCLVSLQREVLLLALGQRFLDQEVALLDQEVTL